MGFLVVVFFFFFFVLFFRSQPKHVLAKHNLEVLVYFHQQHSVLKINLGTCRRTQQQQSLEIWDSFAIFC